MYQFKFELVILECKRPLKSCMSTLLVQSVVLTSSLSGFVFIVWTVFLNPCEVLQGAAFIKLGISDIPARRHSSAIRCVVLCSFLIYFVAIVNVVVVRKKWNVKITSGLSCL